ncbi:MAG: Tex family protein [Flavobacteriales bacterium]
MNDKNLLSISKELNINFRQVKNTLELLASGATIPFISRYRKEATQNLDEVQIAAIQEAHQRILEFEKRKKFILSSIAEQGKLTEELQAKIESCSDIKELEDVYLPYKPRKETKADKAIALGLEPLAKILMAQTGGNFSVIAQKYTNSKVPDVDDAINGAIDIVAQWINERIAIRQKIRGLFWRTGIMHSKLVKGKEQEAEKFKDYFDFQEAIKKIKSHRILALLRGQDEGFLKVAIEPDKQEALIIIKQTIIKPNSTFEEELETAIKEAYTRLIKPAIETEIRNELKAQADVEAIKVFAENLRQLLLLPPLGGKRVLAIDPGFRTGCKVVCLNENGDLLHNETIYPHAPQNETKLAQKKIATLVNQYKIEAIAIGNGTAARETENFIKNTGFTTDVKVFVVNEAGASIYSASKVAREEFPDYDVTVRGSVSIGRRLMDPLAELVKIDPKSIGIGQYQHDVDQKLLQQQLDLVVESCVNKVGVDLNVASKYLLTYISGIGAQLAENIVNYRKENGGFASREELKKVPKLGPKAYEQAAGFLRISEAKNPLDNSAVHPERYKIVEKICKDAKTSVEQLIGNEALINQIIWDNYVDNTIGELTLADIKQELLKPGRDPRKAAKIFEFDKNIKSINDLQVGMKVPGIINNITNFGAFVDIGIKENGLIHISNLADEYIASPSEVVSLHQHVMVKVLEVDKERKRIGLSLKD